MRVHISAAILLDCSLHVRRAVKQQKKKSHAQAASKLSNKRVKYT